jgi:nucleotide-binding universal stress UspA family protein
MTASGDSGAVAFKIILVPLDVSAATPRVFETALRLARLQAARIHLPRVVTVDPVFPPAAHVVPDGLEGKLISDGLAELERFMVAAPDVDFAPAQVVTGDPWRLILDVAREVDADLIVIGSHRYHGVDRIVDRVLGTVASKVVNHADRDVLVVHPSGRAGSSGIESADPMLKLR